MSGRSNVDEQLRSASAGAIVNPRSFAARASSHSSFIRSNSDPSGESLSPSVNRYREGMTIRAVTPEPETEFEGDTDDASTLAHTTTPPRTPSRSTIRSSRWDLLGRASPEPTAPASPDKARSKPNRASMAAAAQLADLSISRAKSRSPTQMARCGRTGATSPDNARFDVNSPGYAARHRFGPSHGVLETSTMPESVGYPSTHSVGYPSTHSVQSVQSHNTARPQTGRSSRHRLLRPSASINTLQSHSTRAYADSPAPTSPINTTSLDFDTLVQLMKRLRGRMEGYVEFRVGDNRSWTKGYCQIDHKSGSFLYQRDENFASSPPTVIIPDLRGCTVKTPADDNDGVIEFVSHSKINIKLRPLNVQQYDHWLAALLCWSPVRPAGVQGKMIKSQIPVLAKEKRRRTQSDATVQNRGEGTIIKVGKMLLWTPGGHTVTPLGSSKSSSKAKPPMGVAWQSISCTLQENGEFRIHRDLDSQILAVVQLSQLSRCAVQQLDPSILDQDFCIAIYPQYTPNPLDSSASRPVYLGIDTQILFEVWFVLLRAFTMPEIYGPALSGSSSMYSSSSLSSSSTLPTIDAGSVIESNKYDGTLADSYRIQRGLYLRIVEAKINMGPNSERESGMDCYAEVHLDGEVRAKTMVRTKTHNPFWREDYEFPDLPSVLTDVCVVLKQRDPRWKVKVNGQVVAGSGGFGGGLGGVSLPGSNDVIIGRVDVRLDELTGGNHEIERWFPLLTTRKNGTDYSVGEMYLRAETEELIVLMGAEYEQLSKVCFSY
jgi:hypothetical protein